MNIIIKIFIAAFFLLLPLIIGIINDELIEQGPESFAGLAGFLTVLLFIPITFFSGLITAVLTRKKKESFKFYVIGFLIPSVVGSILVLVAMNNS